MPSVGGALAYWVHVDSGAGTCTDATKTTKAACKSVYGTWTPTFERAEQATSATCDTNAADSELPRPFGDNSWWNFLVMREMESRMDQVGAYATETCTYERWINDEPCSLKFVVSPPDKLDITVGVVLDKCSADAVLPFFRLSCLGTGCQYFMKLCADDSRCQQSRKRCQLLTTIT